MQNDLVFLIKWLLSPRPMTLCCFPFISFYLFTASPDKLTCPKHYPSLHSSFSSSVPYLIDTNTHPPSLTPLLPPCSQWIIKSFTMPTFKYLSNPSHYSPSLQPSPWSISCLQRYSLLNQFEHGSQNDFFQIGKYDPITLLLKPLNGFPLHLE